jgi:1-acyl-sn-glycerol-3-phosphate acyltransferase
MSWISEFILCRLLGWKIINDFPHHLDKYIIIAGPHTSNWDFPLAVSAKFAKKLKVSFIGKHTLFNPPFGFLFRALGGQPVDRTKSTNLVDSIIDVFNKEDKFVFALSPEGTRKKVSKWKTGFYHVALGANVPIVMATLDFGRKQVLIEEPYYPTGDKAVDFAHFHNFFKDVQGKNPEQFDPDFHTNV